MKINAYESAVIINAALDDEQIEAEVSRLKEHIVNFGGEIIDLDKVGRKRLAYVVNKSKIGYYAIYRYTAPSTIVAKLERIFTLDENILRFLTIRLDKDALEYFEKNKAAILDLIPDVLSPVTPDEVIIDVNS
ncbi:MAG: 30S ribosomal protein S6 [Ignavibacteriaceae bacterium]|nr:30S ribosomal protein S6 [Ignavibacteriaceae bacterium]